MKTRKLQWTLDSIRIDKTISAPIWAPIFFFFFEVSALLDVRHWPKLQSCPTSKKLMTQS